MREFKTQITVVTDLAGSVTPRLRDDLQIEAGVADELLIGTHGTTGVRFVLFRFEYELARRLCDGATTIEGMLAKATQMELKVSRDQLAGFLDELSQLGVVSGTFGIDPSEPIVSLPWRTKAEPAVPHRYLEDDLRRLLVRAIATFRKGDLDASLQLAEMAQSNPAGARLVRLWSGLVAPAEPDDLDEAWGDQRTDLLEVRTVALAPEAAAKPARRIWPWAIAAAIVIAAVPLPMQLRHPCTVEPALTTFARAGLPTALVSVDVKEGQLVEAGQVIGRLDDAAQANEVRLLRSSLDAAKADLRLLEGGNRAERVDAIAARVNGLGRAYAVADRRVRGLRQDVAKGAAPRSALEAAEADRSRIVGETKAAQAELALARAGARTEDIRKAAAEVRALTTQLALEELVLTGAELRAPLAGRVLTVRPSERLGQVFEAGQPVLEIAPLERLRVRVQLPERDFDMVEVGAAFELRLASFPGMKLESTLTRISPTVEEGIVNVEGIIDNPGGVSPGMSGWARIDLGWRPLAVVAGRRAIRWLRVKWVV